MKQLWGQQIYFFLLAEQLPAYQERLCFMELSITLIDMFAIFLFTWCLSTYLAPKKITASRKYTDRNAEDSASYSLVNGRFPFYKPMKRVIVL